MSRLTQTLLRHISYEDIRIRRKENFAWLHERLSAHNDFPLSLSGNEAPLCYPFLSRSGCTPEALRAQRIYVPRYWPEIASSHTAPPFETMLAQDTLFLPCDQRMTSLHLERLLEVLARECDRE
jgi:hypothetical protein